MKIKLKKQGNIIYILSFALILVLTLCLIKGHRSTQYYKQYGNPEVKKDEQSLRFHTPYLSLPGGDYELIVGYSSAGDMDVRVSDRDFVLKASPADSEGFQAFSVSLSDPVDDFCLSWEDPGEGTEALKVYEYELKTTKPVNADAIYSGLLFFLLATGLLLLKYSGILSKLSKKDIAVIVLTASGILLSSLPLFKGYLVYGHDLMGHLKRIEGLKTAIYQGHPIPLVYPGVNNGFGEAAVCYPYFFIYIPAFLRLAGISMPLAYNTLLFLINLFTGIFSYLAFKTITGDELPAAFGAALYLLFPYRLCDLYIRASLGESIAMTFLPLVIWGIYEVAAGDKKRFWILSAGFCGLICSHILSIGLAGLFVLFMSLVFIGKLFKEKRIISLIKAALLCLIVLIPQALLLSVFSGHINLSEISVGDFYRYALYPAQLLMNDASVFTLLDLKDGISGEMTQGIGLVGGIAALLILLRLFKGCKKNSFMSAAGAFALILIFASTTLCPWNYLDKLPVLSTITGMIQFPLRFLSVAAPLLSLEAACFLADLRSGGPADHRAEDLAADQSEVPGSSFYGLLYAASLLVIALISASNVTDAVLRQEVYITDITGGFLRAPYMEYFPKDTPVEVLSDTEPHTSNVEISDYKKRGNSVTFSYVKGEGGGSVLLPLFYYPGYHAKDENKASLPVRKGDSNRLEVILDEKSGSGRVTVDNSIYFLSIYRIW